MNWIFGIIIFVMVIYIFNNHRKAKKQLHLREYYRLEWGKQKKGKYYDFEKIAQYFQHTPRKESAYHLITDEIEADLDIHELFKCLDRTVSKIGQQYLYYKLRVIEGKEQLSCFQKVTELMETNEDLRLNAQLELTKLDTHLAYDLERLVHHDMIKKPSYHKFLLPLSIGYITSFFVGLFYPLFLFILFPLFIVNMMLHYKTKASINHYLRAVSLLDKSLSVAEKLASYPEIRTYQLFDFSFIQNLKSLSFKSKFIAFEKHLNNEFNFIFWFLAELIKIQFNLDAIIFYSFIDDIVKKQKDIDTLYQFLGEIDSAISVASLKYQNEHICEPVFSEEIKVKGLIHPIVENCVPNDLQIKNKSILLTGSNMAGKTTFIRAVALSCITAQTINVAFANSFCMPFYKVCTFIKVSDNLKENKSYYLEEVLRVKKLIEQSDEKNSCLFVLDELFKGTNTIERISGGKAILSYLNKGENCVLVSTHDIELVELLENQDFELYHFSEQVQDKKIFFDYKLRSGRLQTRNALKILELYDYPKVITADAKSVEALYFGEDKKYSL